MNHLQGQWGVLVHAVKGKRYDVVNHQVIYNPAARHESRLVKRPTRDGLEHQRVVKGKHKDLLDIPSFLHYYKRRAMDITRESRG